jgi:Holliday junction resolvase
MASERRLKTVITRYLREQGCVVIPQPGTAFGLAGRPDLLVVVPPYGRALAVEVKSPGGRLTPKQQVMLEQIKAAGGVTVVAYSLDDVQKALEEARGA